MGKHYEKGFKKSALFMLADLKRKKEVILYDTKIRNVRMLCKALKISSYTLYKWKNEAESEELKKYQDLAKFLEMKDYEEIGLKQLKSIISAKIIEDSGL